MNFRSKTRIPWLVFAILFGAAGGALWRSHRQLSEARGTHSHILREAAARGIRLYPENPGQNIRTGRRPRTNLEDEANRIAAEAIHSEGERMEDAAAKKRELGFMLRLDGLNAGQFEIVLAKIRAAGELGTDARNHLYSTVLNAFAEQHPMATLARFEAEPRFLAGDGSQDFFVPLVLTHLAQTHPHEALDWYARNQRNFENITRYKSRSDLVAAIARTDPRFAFELIPKLDLANYDPDADGMVSHPVKRLFLAASTDQNRSATLSAFRSYLSSLQGNARLEALKAAKSGWIEIAGRDGFDGTIDWPEDSRAE